MVDPKQLTDAALENAIKCLEAEQTGAFGFSVDQSTQLDLYYDEAERRGLISFEELAPWEAQAEFYVDGNGREA